MAHTLIVGAGPGLGASLARTFSRHDHAVSLVARGRPGLDRLVRELAPQVASGFTADAADAAELRRAIRDAEAAHGPVDVLIYNPPGRARSSVAELRPEDLVDAFRVNVTGALVAVQTVLPGMRERNAGTVLFTGGGLAIAPLPGFAALAVGKAGQRSLLRSLKLELKDTGVYFGTVLVAGYIQRGTALDPDRIAGEFWRLHTERPADSEVVMRGA